MSAVGATPLILNGGFENGLTGWTASDPTHVNVVSSVAGDGFTGNHAVLNLTDPSGALDVAGLDTFLGLDPGCLEGDGITFGVAIKQDVVVAVDGDVVPFDFHFLSNIASGASNPNQVYVTVASAGSGFNNFLIFSPYADGQALLPTRDGYGFSYNPTGQTEADGGNGFFGLAGTYTLGFLITDGLQGAPTNSGLALDNIGGLVPAGAPEVGCGCGWGWLPAFLLLTLVGERRRGQGLPRS